MNNKESSDGWSLDPAETVNHVSLCAGYGGIDLGLRRAIPNLRTVAFSEIEAFACANLVSKMDAGLLDPAPIWTDVKTFPWAAFRGKVDILSGGYPCQPFSAAGKRLGKDDPRHLWPWIADGIAAMRPRACFFENVEGHITLGLRDVLQDLAGLGYRTSWGIFSASEVGAPHQRKRVFILAHGDGERGQLQDWRRVAAEQVLVGNGAERGDVWPSRPGEPQHAWEPPRVMANAEGCTPRIKTERERREGVGGGSQEIVGDGNGIDRSTSAGGRINDAQAGSAGEGQAQPPLGRDADGTAGRLGDAELFASCDNRTDELRLLGNGVVPQTAEVAWRTLVDELINHKETER